MANILIVEDSTTILSRLSDAITKHLKYTVTQATNFEEARLRLQNNKNFDLALLDLGLPDASEEEIVDYVQKFSIPIVVLTGSDNNKTKELISKKGILEYIIKDRAYAVEYAISLVKRFIKNKNTKVMVVDDSKTFCAKIAHICKGYNLDALIAYNGKDALEILSKNQDIKLIFTDYNMPNMDGLELTTLIRKDFRKDELSIIALSGSDEKDIVAKFLRYGANDFIAKDFSPEELIARLNASLEIIELFELTKAQANTDYLTNLFNRRYFFENGEKYLNIAKTNNKNLSIAMIDIDFFKKINDTYGHDVGDMVLKFISKLFLNELKANAIISRFGGEEFCLLFQDMDSLQTLKVLEDFRKLVNNSFIKNNDKKVTFTISGGICSNTTKSLDEMIKEADKLLYKSKENGRNQISI